MFGLFKWILEKGRSDIALAILLMAIIFLMIIPMPTFVVDILLAVNMSIAVILLMVALYIPTPRSLSAFPSILLITTLFRLSLSITTTRLVLLNADAGKIVDTFGNFVVAGNLVVGLVIFLIITIVQFVVITKGAERVAEVGARFSLDAMPGKQMSIDGDMKSGNLTIEEAKKLRGALQQESQLYGAMDGAMKFVKGDAIAGLIITVINIVGGISIGVLQKGYPLNKALHIFSILTVGDGLVAQIPALLISVTAGIIVTRVSMEGSTNNLAEDIGGQLLKYPKALAVASGILCLFAAIPGFPSPIFLFLSASLFGMSVILKQLPASEGDKSLSDSVMDLDKEVSSGDAVDAVEKWKGVSELKMTNPVSVDVSYEKRKTVNPDHLDKLLTRVRRALYLDLGVPFPAITLRYVKSLALDVYVINFHEIPSARGYIRDGYVFVCENPEDLDSVNIPYETGETFLPVYKTIWVAEGYVERLKSLGISFFTQDGLLSFHLSRLLKQKAEDFLGIQETHVLVATMEQEYSELVKEVQRVMPLQRITDILKRLVSEGISIRNTRKIFEALVDWGKKEKDAVLLAEYVRGSLSSYICHKYCTDQNILPAYMFVPDLEEKIRTAIRQTSSGSYLAMDPAGVRKVITELRKVVGDIGLRKEKPVLLVSMDIRRYVRKMIETDFYELPVLSYQELSRDINVQPLGRISVTFDGA